MAPALLSRLLNPNEKEVRQHLKTAQRIGELEPELKASTDAEVRARADDLREQAKAGEDLDTLLVEAFALTREAGRRTIGMRHFDVQMVGGIVLHEGKIAEMKTGEGKTLVASLPLVLNGLAGKGAHLVTVNDFLVRRDAGWMAPLYALLGLSVGIIHSPQDGLEGSYVYDPEYTDEAHGDERLRHLRPASRHEAYLCDITYGTNNEFGFDYLRDNMAWSLDELVQQRGHHFAIVDEVDSILIDEARTPLIISGPSDDSSRLYYQFASI
ncbi:MAG: preprotein translocase subunit SecA, partial [Candidatus Dormibacteraceae bacterium]